MTDFLKDYTPRKTLAEVLGVTEKTLIRWELDSKGPPVTRIGRQVLYYNPSTEKWLRSQEQSAA
jgi:DNA-binding XRE family transcriptional regulator